MTPYTFYTFPDFAVWLSTRRKLEKTEYAASSLSYTGAYGQAGVWRLSIVGEQARQIMNSGELEGGLYMLQVYAGYAGDLRLVGRNLLIWEDDYQADSEAGDTLTLTAYGCSQYLRESGDRTLKLAARTYADAAREVAARWGLPIRVGSGAYRDIPEQPSADNTVQAVSTVAPTAAPTSNPANTNVLRAALQVASGQRLPNMTSDTVTQSGWCAQFVRQVVEYALGYGSGAWPVYKNALVEAHDEARRATYAVDYEAATGVMGLRHDDPLVPGDILFQGNVSLPYGHVAIYVGEVGGVPSVIENTTASRGTPVFGAGPVRLTPLSAFGSYTTAAYPAPLEADSQAQTNVLGNLVPGVKGTVAGAITRRKAITQENESDWDFLAKLGRQIGYIVAETPLGDELYFGPGLEVGSRERHLLVRGAYTLAGRPIPPNVGRLGSSRSLYSLPAEIVVTGYERGKRFALIVTPDQLADQHQLVDADQQEQTVPPKTNVIGDLVPGVTGTLSYNSAGQAIDPTTGRYKRTKASAGDFAGKKVGDLLDANGYRRRMVLGGSSDKADALERGLEALALDNLRYQEVTVDLFGIPTLKPGDEVLLMGSEVPKPLQGLYLVRQVGGNLDGERGFDMNLILNRNTL